MKRTMIALTALALLSSFNTSAEDQSHAFNDAVSTLHQLQEQEKDNLAHYNETDSNDGTGRFNADGSFNDSLAMQGDKIRADRRAAQRQVNGTTYRNQVQQQQTDAKAADLANTVAQSNERVSHDDRLRGAMARQPMATLSPAVNIGVKTPVQSMPSVILNKPVSVSKITFATGKGNAGGQGGHASHGGSGNRGGDNAHSAAFGGHGYGHDNSRSEGFGGHSHFH
mgnify:CR=1 FL=1